MNTLWIIIGIFSFGLICLLTVRMVIRDRRFRIVNKALADAYNELTDANAQIREYAERKSAFLASMSHELRTPITAIKGYVDNMCDGFSGDLNDKQRHNLRRVSQNTAHLLNLIDNLLDLSKLEVGRMNVNASRFEVEDLIVYCVSTVQGLAKEGVTVHYVITPQVGKVFTDELRLRQILINLLGNAVKFTDEGVIRVTAKMVDNDVMEQMLEIVVSDTGTGIAKDELEMIFDEYRQAEGGGSVQKGTGLGLSITRKFVALLGGTIGVESQVGKGSKFIVTIPVTYKG
jgi:signal transduction histidine kinase